MPSVDVVTITTDLNQVDARRDERDEQTSQDDRLAGIDDAPVTPHVAFLCFNSIGK